MSQFATLSVGDLVLPPLATGATRLKRGQPSVRKLDLVLHSTIVHRFCPGGPRAGRSQHDGASPWPSSSSNKVPSGGMNARNHELSQTTDLVSHSFPTVKGPRHDRHSSRGTDPGHAPRQISPGSTPRH